MIFMNLINKIKSFFKKNVKVQVVDDSITLKKNEIRTFLDKELKEKISNIKETVTVSYQYLDQNIQDVKKIILQKKERYDSVLSKLLEEIKIPKSDDYFEAHVFASSKLREFNNFIYETRKIRKRKILLQKVFVLRDIFLNMKKIIDSSGLLFYDVLLEETENQKTIVPVSMLEYQIYKLTNKKVTITD